MRRLRLAAGILVAGLIGATVGYSQGADSRTIAELNLRDYVDDDTWERAGFDGLSRDERAAFESWFRGYTLHCYRTYARKPNANSSAPAPPGLVTQVLRYQGRLGEEPENAHSIRSASGALVVLDDGSRWRIRRTTADLRMLEVWQSGDEAYVFEATAGDKRRFPTLHYKIRNRARGPGFVRVEFLGY